MKLVPLLIHRVVLAVLAITFVIHPARAADTKIHTVTIELIKFNPPSLVIKKGDTVIWINKDIVPHTATESKKRFDSGVLNGDQSWKYIARVAGKFHYACNLHPTMKAEITVE